MKQVKKKRKFKKIVKILAVFIFIFLAIEYIYPFILNIFQNNIKDLFPNNFETNETISSYNTSIKGTTLSRLKNLSKKDYRINKIIDNYDSYPEDLLDMLSRNIEMVDFVLDFPKKKGNVYSDNVGKVNKGTIPLLLQWDKRWGYASYGENNIAISGCGPTALSMVYVGLTGDSSMTPYKIAKFAEENGFYLNGTGTSWYLMTDGANKLGLTSEEISLSKSLVLSLLENGYPIICSMGPGDFTMSGHFIVLTDVKDGKIKVNDPNSKKRSSILWDYDKLEYQIKNLWKFSY